MTRAAFRRARRPEHKQQRREAILAAARELARTSGVRNVSLGAVADAVGLAKSNIVRYFGTREEIYLELLAEEWRSWADAVAAALHDEPAGQAEGVRRVVGVLTGTLVERPLFCDLMSHSSNSLEHNVSVSAARMYKRTAIGVTAELGAQVAPRRRADRARGRRTGGGPPAGWPGCSTRPPTRRPLSSRSTPRTPSWPPPAPRWSPCSPAH
ncbi:hypothetical protein GCM10020001_036600 [Nonomuraea salmonea]